MISIFVYSHVTVFVECGVVLCIIVDWTTQEKMMSDDNRNVSLFIAQGTACRNDQTVERVNANASCYRWKIKNFSKVKRNTLDYIYSPSFGDIHSQIRWRLKLFPNGEPNGDSDFMLLGIYYRSSTFLTATVELSVVNIDNEVLNTFKLKKVVDTENIEELYGDFLTVQSGNYFKFARRSDIEDPCNCILADTCLTISCDITYHDPIVVIPITNNRESLKNEEMEFNNFEKLLDDGKFSDVTFIVDGKTIQAHKAILATRSPVFEAMFTIEMRERKQNIVEIVDIDYVAVKKLFQFMYTGAVDEIEEVACELMVAADKYCVVRLKALCEKTLLDSLQIDNAVQCLLTADICNAAKLRKRALDLIVKNSRSIVEKEEFGLLPRELMWEVTRALSKRKTNTF